VCLIAVTITVVTIGARSAEIGRRLHYWRYGTVRTEGVLVKLPPEDPFLQYLLARGTRDIESELTDYLRDTLKPGDTFVDVGANVGWFTLIAAKAVGPTGRVVAVEPEPRNAAKLRGNVAANGFGNVTVLEKAASDTPGTLSLHIADLGENHSVADLGYGRGTVSVEAVRLDDAITGPVRLIKVDVEGYEAQVLAGLERTPRDNPGVVLVIEFDPVLLGAAGTDPGALLRSLADKGFRPKRLGGNLLLAR